MKLAARIGIHTVRIFRDSGGILYTLLQASGEGHVSAGQRFDPARGSARPSAGAIADQLPEPFDG